MMPKEITTSAPSGERYLSLTHMVPDKPPDRDGLQLFQLGTAEIVKLTADQDPAIVAIYRDIVSALQGPPRTRQEILASLQVSDENQRLAAEIFDALARMDVIVAVNGLARALATLWQNPRPYDSDNLAIENARQVSMPPGVTTHALEMLPTSETRIEPEPMTLRLDDLGQMLGHALRETSELTSLLGDTPLVHIHVFNHADRIVADQGRLGAGILQYDSVRHTLERRIAVQNDALHRTLEYVTGDPDATDAAAWLLLSIDMATLQNRYGNAALQLQGIAIGAVMQRIIDSATSLGYKGWPSFEIQHRDGDNIIGNGEDVKMVLAVALGHPNAATGNMKEHFAAQLDRVAVGTVNLLKKPTRVDMGNAKYTGMPGNFVAASVEYAQTTTGEVEIDTSFGTAPTYSEAALKAMAEALERLAGAEIRVDATAPANTLAADWLDPRVVMPMDAQQLQELDVLPFSPDLTLNWTAGKRLYGGATVYAPSSLVYYPYQADDAIARANSNGVAAHFDHEVAVERAFLELVERDAVMRTWITRRPPHQLSPDALPPSVAYRVAEVASFNKTAVILDITQQEPSVPSYLVVVRGDTFPRFYVGAAADFDPERALHKALDEALAGYTTRILTEESLVAEESERRAHGTFDMESHSMLYTDPAMIATVEWLFEGSPRELPDAATIPTFRQLIERYNPAVFDLKNPAPGNELKIVRVIAEGLVPITFGEVGVPYLHASLPPGSQPPPYPHFFN